MVNGGCTICSARGFDIPAADRWRHHLEGARRRASIAPAYKRGPAIHVLDASRAVAVAGQLLSSETYGDYTKGVAAEYEVLRERRKAGPTHQAMTLEPPAPTR